MLLYLLLVNRNVAQQDPSLGRRILNWLNSLLAKLGGKDAQDAAFVRRARDLYAAALRQTEGSFIAQTAKAQAPAQQSSPEAAATAEAATAVQQNTTGINENMSPAEMRQWALDAYNAGQISEQTLDQILDDIDAQEELNGSGISLEAELNRLNQEPAKQHYISPTFADEIEQWDGKSQETFRIGTTSEALKSIGVKDQGIVWFSGKISKIMRKHSAMTKEVIKQVPEILEHPVAVLASKRYESRLVIFGTITDTNGDPVTAILELQPTTDGGDIMDLSVIASAYGKDGDVARFVSESGLVYLDPERKRTESWMQSVGLQLPSDATAFGSIGRVSYPDGKVKIDSIPYDQYMRKDLDDTSDAQHSISAPAERQSIIRDLRSILDRGGDPNELRRYVTQLEQGTQTADRVTSVSGQEGTEAQRILQAARDRGIGVEEYLEQNWERYDVDGQWNDAARQALELEQGQSRRQHSISAPVNRMTDAEIQAVQNIGGISVNQFSAADIQATKRFALQYWKEMGVRSPFFRAWFGDWRDNDQTPVQIATQKGNARGVQKNTDTGWDVQVSGQVFNETKIHRSVAVREARQYLPYINDIVAKAVLLDSYGFDSGDIKSENSLLMHSLYAVADIGDGPEVLKLYVEEMNDPNSAETKKRAYQLQNIEKAFGASVRVQGNALSSLTNTQNAISTVADLFAAVKRMDSNFKPKPASEVVNDDGTPKVVYHGSADLFDTFSYRHIGSASGVSVLGDGFYFTDQKKLAKNYGENVYECYLQMKTPYMANAADSYRLNTTQLKAQGYDGVILNAPNGNVYMVFDNTQIKSATDNIGTFDGNDPNIRHSISEAPGTEVAQDTAGDFTVENEVDDVRSVLPKKARDYLKRTERTLLNSISRNLGVPWFAQREYLQPLVEKISNEYLKNGTVSKETVDRLFDTAYDEGIVVDREFYDQYKDIKDYLPDDVDTNSKFRYYIPKAVI